MQSVPKRGKHPMRAVGEFCAMLWGPSGKGGGGRPQPRPGMPAGVPNAADFGHAGVNGIGNQPPGVGDGQGQGAVPVIAKRANVEEVILSPEMARAQGLPLGVVLRRTTIDEICVVPESKTGSGGPQGPVGPQGPGGF